MKSLKPGSLFVLALLAFSPQLAASVPVSVAVTEDFDKKTVVVNHLARAVLKASATAPTSDYYCTYDPPSAWIWTWEVVSPAANAYVSISPDGSDPSKATVIASFSEPGAFTITVKASVSIGCTCGQSETGSGTVELYNTAVQVANIQFSVDGAIYKDVPSPFFVPKGQSVTFKAMPNPDSATWPSGYPTWGGEATGTGSAATVTFNTLTTTSFDFQTVTASCGNTKTVNIVVYELVPILTPDDNFDGRDLDAYGVCEFINLSYTIAPSGITEYDLGGLQWIIETGEGDLLGSAAGTGLYQCPDVAATVALALQYVGGPFVAQAAKAGPKDIVPTDGTKVLRKEGTSLWHEKGKCSVGFCGDIFATGKKIVSYKEIEVREGSGFSEATGYWKKLGLDEMNHSLTMWRELKGFVKDKGYQWNLDANIRKYDKILLSGIPPFSVGTFKWPIEHQYRKKGDEESFGRKYGIANHEVEATATGTCTIRKAGSGDFSKEAKDETIIPENW